MTSERLTEFSPEDVAKLKQIISQQRKEPRDISIRSTIEFFRTHNNVYEGWVVEAEYDFHPNKYTELWLIVDLRNSSSDEEFYSQYIVTLPW